MNPLLLEGASLLETLQNQLKNHCNSLPQAVRGGLWQLSEQNAELFLNSTESLTVLLIHQSDTMDALMAKISIAAQKDPFSEEVRLTDTILSKYTEFRQQLNRCLSACEVLRKAPQNEMDPRPLWNALSLLIQKGDALYQLFQVNG